MIPPRKLEEARKFSCCFPYSRYTICIYLGGSHQLYWGYIIYDLDGNCHYYDRLPDSQTRVWEVKEGREFLRIVNLLTDID